MATRAKEFSYNVGVDHTGAMTAEGGAAMSPQTAWTPEHLVLAGLCQCTLKSLAFSAGRLGATVSGGASARGVVTRRDDDGRYALISAEVLLDVTIDPPPDDLDRLLAAAERGCFVGASLRASPDYRWTVNGSRVS